MALPALASAATISGTVREAAGAQAPLEGVRVCADQQNFGLEEWCADTDSAGNYSLSVEAGEYSVHFNDEARNRNVVSQYYGGTTYPGTLVNLASLGDSATGIDAQLQPGSTIAGTVTDAVTHAGVAGILVCAEIQSPFPHGRCERSGVGGGYVINGLESGIYEVDYRSPRNDLGWFDLNYQPQRYKEKNPSFGSGTPVEILGPGETVAAIDAALAPGAEITGTLTETGTGRPLPELAVSLYYPAIKELDQWVETDAAGHFAFRGLPAGKRVLAFSSPLTVDDFDCYSTQYYRGSESLTGATVLETVPGQALTGIDGEVRFECIYPPPEPRRGDPPPSTSPPPGPAVTSKRKPLRCRAGFRKRKVNGKPRCLKRHKHHRAHHRKAGK